MLNDWKLKTKQSDHKQTIIWLSYLPMTSMRWISQFKARLAHVAIALLVTLSVVMGVLTLVFQHSSLVKRFDCSTTTFNCERCI